MLPRGARPGRLREAALATPQPPQDLPAVRVDVVDGPRVASGHEQASVVVEADRVDVEEVEGPGRRRGDRTFVGLAEADVVQARPFEHDKARPDVYFLNDPVGNRPGRGA